MREIRKQNKKKLEPKRIHEGSINETYDLRRGKFTNKEYNEYLKSKEWALKRDKWIILKRFKWCRKKGCKVAKVDIHHTSYKRVGTPEEGMDVIALCREHHQKVHDVSKKTGLSVRLATNMVIYNKHELILQ